jgi:hypothetical protein
MSFNREAGNVTCPGGCSGTATAWGTSVAGPGRTFYVGMKIDF